MTTITDRSSSRVQRENRLRQWLSRDTFTAYLFLAIPLLLFIFTKFYPVLYNVVLSFTNYDLFSPMKFTGLENYRYIFTNEVTLKAIRNTVLFTIGIVPIGTSLSLTVATLLNQPIHGRVAFRTIYYLPVITSGVVTSLIWKFIYSQQQTGLLNQFLSLFGVAPQGWLTDPRLARFSLFVISWWGLGGSMVIFLARPRSSTRVLSSLWPKSSEMTTPPVRMAISWSISFLRSPNPGAFTAATCSVPRSLLTTKVASASPSTSSAMMTKGLDCWTTFSSTGSRSFMLLIFLS